MSTHDDDARHTEGVLTDAELREAIADVVGFDYDLHRNCIYERSNRAPDFVMSQHQQLAAHLRDISVAEADYMEKTGLMMMVSNAADFPMTAEYVSFRPDSRAKRYKKPAIAAIYDEVVDDG